MASADAATVAVFDSMAPLCFAMILGSLFVIAFFAVTVIVAQRKAIGRESHDCSALAIMMSSSSCCDAISFVAAGPAQGIDCVREAAHAVRAALAQLTPANVLARCWSSCAATAAATAPSPALSTIMQRSAARCSCSTAASDAAASAAACARCRA